MQEIRADERQGKVYYWAAFAFIGNVLLVFLLLNFEPKNIKYIYEDSI